MTLRFLFSFIFIIALSGCVTKSLTLLDAKKNIPLEKANHWKLNARVAIRLPKESHTASLNWQKNNKTFDFYLSGAFGVTIAHIIQGEKQASIEVAKSEKLYHKDIELLVHNTLGWSFPIHQLSYWVKGLPSGNDKEIITRDSFDRIKHISFEEWEISFSKYRKYRGFILPKIITAKHPNLTLKIVAKKWQFYE
ncbi:MAG: outer membrane lipoprotein LolB [Gammaproteobacteria bacterium]|nr:MAG: outer membrane lipoprotein LolB [Gammaproteobacteria bacterium]